MSRKASSHRDSDDVCSPTATILASLKLTSTCLSGCHNKLFLGVMLFSILSKMPIVVFQTLGKGGPQATADI